MIKKDNKIAIFYQQKQYLFKIDGNIEMYLKVEDNASM